MVDFSDYPKGLSCITDTRSVDELLTFINGEQDADQSMKNRASSKAAKRQRQKQKKVNSNLFFNMQVLLYRYYYYNCRSFVSNHLSYVKTTPTG